MGLRSTLRAFLVVCAIAAATAQTAADGWQRIEAGLPLELPRDHGMHAAMRTEWWYATGALRTPAGDVHGVQATIFRQGIEPGPRPAGESPLRARQAWAAHVAWLDAAEGRMRHVERARRDGLDLARGSSSLLDVRVDDSSMTMESDGAVRIRCGAREEGFEIELRCAPTRGWTRHGKDGVSRKGPEAGNASLYLSATRCATTGTLRRRGPDGAWSETPLAGEMWFDHEWGSSQLGAGVVGWDWLGLRLADGRDLMLYRMRTKDGGVLAESSGTIVGADGTLVHLSRDDFAIEELAHWESPRTKGVWPVRLRLLVPGHGIDAEAAALARDCEIDGSTSTGTVYWEGPVRLSGSVQGEGYLETVGRAGSLEARF